MMMALGLFVFMRQTTPYQNFEHQIGWRHPSNSRVGLRPATQFLGQDDETITLSGVLLPELTGGTLSLEAMRLMADTGLAWPLIEGTGFVYGMFVITELSKTRTEFFKDGAARRIEFRLSLKRVDDNLRHLLGDLDLSRYMP
ncbi:phage tail protein [Enterobacter ludwigii]|nr:MULTISPECIES: phage tail protein [Enterobacteriaceae]MCU6243829.1 phage tail protein [Enterobacter asburiae]RTP91539.1 phage tail protein [Enterobacter asburiae]WGA02999.1 phage tail protein [Enterobacter ludwigii]